MENLEKGNRIVTGKTRIEHDFMVIMIITIRMKQGDELMKSGRMIK